MEGTTWDLAMNTLTNSTCENPAFFTRTEISFTEWCQKVGADLLPPRRLSWYSGLPSHRTLPFSRVAICLVSSKLCSGTEKIKAPCFFNMRQHSLNPWMSSGTCSKTWLDVTKSKVESANVNYWTSWLSIPLCFTPNSCAGKYSDVITPPKFSFK